MKNLVKILYFIKVKPFVYGINNIRDLHLFMQAYYIGYSDAMPEGEEFLDFDISDFWVYISKSLNHSSSGFLTPIIEIQTSEEHGLKIFFDIFDEYIEIKRKEQVDKV